MKSLDLKMFSYLWRHQKRLFFSGKNEIKALINYLFYL